MAGLVARDGEEWRSPRAAPMPEALKSMVDQVRGLASGPLWALPGEAVPAAVGQAHALAEAATALVAVLTGEAAERGLPGESGLSSADWVAAHAEGMDRRSVVTIGMVAPALEQRSARPRRPSGSSGCNGLGGP